MYSFLVLKCDNTQVSPLKLFQWRPKPVSIALLSFDFNRGFKDPLAPLFFYVWPFPQDLFFEILCVKVLSHLFPCGTSKSCKACSWCIFPTVGIAATTFESRHLQDLPAAAATGVIRPGVINPGAGQVSGHKRHSRPILEQTGSGLVLVCVLARRKPRLLLRFPGVFLLRFAERQFLALLFQLPPRFTRLEP